MIIYTIGHSTRSLDELVALLRAHGVTQLADVRTVPKSRRHPHFSREALSASLPAAGIAYRHAADLGGLRKPRADSRNTGWRHPSFRGYADYMETDVFERGLDELIEWAEQAALPPSRLSRFGESRRSSSESPASGGGKACATSGATAVMCAEAVWWQCHRQLIADALVARGIEVRHIMSATAAPPHTLTQFSRVNADLRVTYPGLI